MTATTYASRAADSSAEGTSQSRHSIRLHAGLIAAAATFVAALQFALIDRGGFWLDDFVNLAEAKRLGLSGALMVEPVYQHFAPGHRVLDWLVAVPLGESYTAAALILTAFIAGAVVVFTLLLDECFGRSDLHVLLAALAGACWTITDTAGWFAAAAHSLPSIFIVNLALLFYVRWYRVRTTRRYLLALVTFAVALMFWELSLLFLVEAALVAALVLGPHDSTRAVAQSLWRALPGLVPFAALALVYLIYVSAQPWHQPFDAPTLAQLEQFTRIFLLRGWLPPLVGTGTPFGPISSFEHATQILAGALVLGGVVLAVLTRRAIVRATVFFVTGALVVWFAVAGYRLHSGGVWVGETPRLITPLPFLFSFAVAIALQPAAGRQLLRVRRLRVPAGPWPAALKALAAAAVLGVAVAYALNLKHTDDVRSYGRLEGDAGSAKAAVIARGVELARSRHLLASFVEGPVPEPVAFPGRWDDTLWRMGPYFDRGISAVGQGSVLLTIGIDGVVRENSFAAAPLAAGSRAVSCRSASSCTLGLRARTPLPNSPAYVRVTLTARGPTRLSLASIPPAEAQDGVEHRTYYDDTTRHLVLGAGKHTVVLALWTGAVASARVTATGQPTSLRGELGVLVTGPPLS